MFTSWEQVKAWIEDNNFPHWVFYKKDPEGRTDKDNDKIIDSNTFTVSDLADKLAMTEKYIRMYGGHVWGVGFKSPNATTGGVVCQARIEASAEGASGVGAAALTAQTIGELRESITREIRAQIKAEQYEKDKANFEREKKEWEAEKQSAIGTIVHLLAPIGKQLVQNRMMPKVAGVDAEEPVQAARIEVQENAPETKDAPENEDPFTEEEAQQIMELMVRFKAAEPDYLQLISRVVEMAESGDATYTMAKGALVK